MEKDLKEKRLKRRQTLTTLQE